MQRLSWAYRDLRGDLRPRDASLVMVEAEGDHKQCQSLCVNDRHLLQADAVGEHEIAASGEDMPHVYSIAHQLYDFSNEVLGQTQEIEPDGFTRTESALGDYVSDLRSRMKKSMDMTDDPRPSTIDAFIRANGSDYVGPLFNAFISEVSHTRLTNAEQLRVMKRLRGN